MLDVKLFNEGISGRGHRSQSVKVLRRCPIPLQSAIRAREGAVVALPRPLSLAMAAPAVEVEEKDQGDYRDLLNLLPAWWLPLSVRNLVMIRVILTGFLGEPWVTKAVDEVPCREKYTGNHGKGGRPKKHQQVQVRSSGRFGGQAASG